MKRTANLQLQNPADKKIDTMITEKRKFTPQEEAFVAKAIQDGKRCQSEEPDNDEHARHIKTFRHWYRSFLDGTIGVVDWYHPLPTPTTKQTEFDGFAYASSISTTPDNDEYILVAEHNGNEGESWWTAWPYSSEYKNDIATFAAMVNKERDVVNARLIKHYQTEFKNNLEDRNGMPGCWKIGYARHCLTGIGKCCFEVGRVRYTRDEVEQFEKDEDDSGYQCKFIIVDNVTPKDIASFCRRTKNTNGLYKTALRDIPCAKDTNEEDNQKDEKENNKKEGEYKQYNSVKDAFAKTSVARVDPSLWMTLERNKWYLVLSDKTDEKTSTIIRPDGTSTMVDFPFVMFESELNEVLEEKHIPGGASVLCIRYSHCFYDNDDYFLRPRTVSELVADDIKHAKRHTLHVVQKCPPKVGVWNAEREKYNASYTAWMVRIDT